MWTYRQNETTGRWEVLHEESGVIDSAHWLSEDAARARAAQLTPSLGIQAAAGDGTQGRAFYAVLCVNDWLTAGGDRYFEAFDWAQVPLSLWAMDTQSYGGHEGGTISGAIETIEKLSDNRRIFATGHMLTTEDGVETEAQIESGAMRFVSVDPAGYEVEEEITKLGTDGWPTEGRLRFTSYTIGGATVLGNPAIRLAVIWLDGMDAPAELTDPLPPPVARVEIPEIVDVDDGDIIIIQASAAGDEGREPAANAAIIADDEGMRTLLASAHDARAATACQLTRDCGGPALPPAEWFDDPQLEQPTRLTVTPDGHVFGHIALWDTPHRGFLHYSYSERIYAPRSTNDYAQYLLNRTPVACCSDSACGHDNETRASGPLILATTHAPSPLNGRQAAAFYENTGAACADVACGEDSLGVWVAGSLRPGQDDARVRELLGAAPSGDWRWIAGNLDLIGVLMVNSPGFPVRASSWADEAGEVRTLIVGFGENHEVDEALVASVAGVLAPATTDAHQHEHEQVETVQVPREWFERVDADLATLRPVIAERLEVEVLG